MFNMVEAREDDEAAQARALARTQADMPPEEAGQEAGAVAVDGVPAGAVGLPALTAVGADGAVPAEMLLEQVSTLGFTAVHIYIIIYTSYTSYTMLW